MYKGVTTVLPMSFFWSLEKLKEVKEICETSEQKNMAG